MSGIVFNIFREAQENSKPISHSGDHTTAACIYNFALSIIRKIGSIFRKIGSIFDSNRTCTRPNSPQRPQTNFIRNMGVSSAAAKPPPSSTTKEIKEGRLILGTKNQYATGEENRNSCSAMATTFLDTFLTTDDTNSEIDEMIEQGASLYQTALSNRSDGPGYESLQFSPFDIPHTSSLNTDDQLGSKKVNNADELKAELHEAVSSVQGQIKKPNSKKGMSVVFNNKTYGILVEIKDDKPIYRFFDSHGNTKSDNKAFIFEATNLDDFVEFIGSVVDVMPTELEDGLQQSLLKDELSEEELRDLQDSDSNTLGFCVLSQPYIACTAKLEIDPNIVDVDEGESSTQLGTQETATRNPPTQLGATSANPTSSAKQKKSVSNEKREPSGVKGWVLKKAARSTGSILNKVIEKKAVKLEKSGLIDKVGAGASAGVASGLVLGSVVGGTTGAALLGPAGLVVGASIAYKQHQSNQKTKKPSKPNSKFFKDKLADQINLKPFTEPLGKQAKRVGLVAGVVMLGAASISSSLVLGVAGLSMIVLTK